MSFGGSVGAMINSLKRNARPRKKAFEQTKKFLKDHPPKREEIDIQPLTLEQKHQISGKLEKQRAQSRKKRIVIAIITIVILIGLLYLGNSFFHYNAQHYRDLYR